MKIIRSGDVIGEWLVLGDPNGTRLDRVLCRCKCGKEKVVSAYHLKVGKTSKCAECSRKERRTRPKQVLNLDCKAVRYVERERSKI